MDTKNKTIHHHPADSKTPAKQTHFVFEKENYILMIISIVVITIGFMLMSGGGIDDPTKFNADEIFSFRRITLAPIVVLIGFAIAGWSILKKTKE